MVFHGELSIGVTISERCSLENCCLWLWPMNLRP